MTPYSGTFLGYEVEKGKLSLDLTYNINHKDLDAKNSIFVDQFTFGKGVDSPKATKLPVRFAVALLKDAQGRIDLKIPVQGRTDDPKFSVWGIVLTVLKNLVMKAATSPFLLLDAMYPGASTASTVEFDAGRSDLPDGSDVKFATITKILEDKPALNLEIRGYADPESDRQGLAAYFFERKLKAQKLKVMLARGQKGLPLRDITITPEEYPVYLKKAYKDEEFTKPRNVLGLAVDLPPAEMEKLIKQHIEVADSDLRLLAVNRAQKVQEFLASTQKVAPSRIFIIETGGDAPGAKQGVKGSRVELMLK
jgi:outer membrane protein OmpA-like peptidoglycan-associated protein